MKPNLRLLFLIGGVLVAAFIRCGSETTPEKYFARERIQTSPPKTEAPAEQTVVDDRLAEIEERLTQRTYELRKVEDEIRRCETRLDTLEQHLARLDEFASSEIGSLRQMNQFAWIIAAVLSLILLSGWLRFRRRKR